MPIWVQSGRLMRDGTEAGIRVAPMLLAAPVLPAVTLQPLAALTLPHTMLDAWLERRDAAGATASASPAYPPV